MRRLAGLALLTYPLAYRRRYGEEMRALLDDTSVSARAVADLFRGALIAHLRPAPGCEVAGEDRLRLTAYGVLACWLAFAVAGLAFYKTVEGSPFTAPGEAHPLLGTSYLAVQITAALASSTVVVGAALFVFVSPRRAVIASAVVTVAMVAIAAAVAVYAVALSGLAPAGEGNGPGGLISVELSLVLQLAAMVGLAALAALSSLRGLRTLRRVNVTT